ncbi:HEAT repeat domain-containing protein [Planctomycetota bacterium]|nr:HEAT repeat domain-containing protein [Planctomycetota bacterium]
MSRNALAGLLVVSVVLNVGLGIAALQGGSAEAGPETPPDLAELQSPGGTPGERGPRDVVVNDDSVSSTPDRVRSEIEALHATLERTRSEVVALRAQLRELESSQENAQLAEPSATSEPAPDPTARTRVRELLGMFTSMKNAGEGANAGQLQSELMPKLMRLMSEREAATEALFEVIADRADPGREAALSLLSTLSMLPGDSPNAGAANAQLIEMLEADEEPVFRAQLINALDLEGDPDGQRAAEPVLLRLTRSENEKVRREAIRQLEDIPSPATHAELLRVMQDEGETPRLRAKAIDAIDFDHEPRAPAVVVALSRHTETTVRKTAFGRFRDMDAALALPRLHDALSGESDPWVLSAIFRAMRKHGTGDTLARVEAYAQDEARDVEFRARAQETVDDLRATLADR